MGDSLITESRSVGPALSLHFGEADALARRVVQPLVQFHHPHGPIETHEREEYHWHMELIPKLTKTAGFEWGTGFYINPTSPELAAEVLRNAHSTRPADAGLAQGSGE